MLKIRKKDKVVLTCGKDKGKTGEVMKVVISGSTKRVVVSKLNMATKHKRPKQTEPGGRQQVESPIDISNVKLVCPKCDQAMRPKFDRLQTGEKVRVCGKCGEVIL